eukprot:jgi/Chlat1/8568/Chrsp82S07961
MDQVSISAGSLCSPWVQVATLAECVAAAVAAMEEEEQQGAGVGVMHENEVEQTYHAQFQAEEAAAAGDEDIGGDGAGASRQGGPPARAKKKKKPSRVRKISDHLSYFAEVTDRQYLANYVLRQQARKGCDAAERRAWVEQQYGPQGAIARAFSNANDNNNEESSDPFLPSDDEDEPLIASSSSSDMDEDADEEYTKEELLKDTRKKKKKEMKKGTKRRRGEEDLDESGDDIDEKGKGVVVGEQDNNPIKQERGQPLGDLRLMVKVLMETERALPPLERHTWQQIYLWLKRDHAYKRKASVVMLYHKYMNQRLTLSEEFYGSGVRMQLEEELLPRAKARAPGKLPGMRDEAQNMKVCAVCGVQYHGERHHGGGRSHPSRCTCLSVCTLHNTQHKHIPSTIIRSCPLQCFADGTPYENLYEVGVPGVTVQPVQRRIPGSISAADKYRCGYPACGFFASDRPGRKSEKPSDERKVMLTHWKKAHAGVHEEPDAVVDRAFAAEHVGHFDGAWQGALLALHKTAAELTVLMQRPQLQHSLPPSASISMSAILQSYMRDLLSKKLQENSAHL